MVEHVPGDAAGRVASWPAGRLAAAGLQCREDRVTERPHRTLIIRCDRPGPDPDPRAVRALGLEDVGRDFVPVAPAAAWAFPQGRWRSRDRPVKGRPGGVEELADALRL